MKLITTTACIAVLAASALNTQAATAHTSARSTQSPKPERGAYVARIGKDTLAVETYERTPTKLTGRSILRAKTIMVREYTMDFAPDGSVSRYDLRTFPLRVFQSNSVTYTDATGKSYTPSPAYGVVLTDSLAPRQQTYVYHGDSVTVTMRDGTNTRTVVVNAPANALPFSENTFVTWQESVRRAKPGRDVSFIVGGNKLKYSVERPSPRKMVLNGVSNDFGPMLVSLDAQGRMTQLDMRATTDKYLVDRVDSLDLNTLASRFVAHPLGSLSPRDTARVIIQTVATGVTNIAIDYSRPSMRGRLVFGTGGMQPWGEVWRLGADQATQLITDHDLDIAGTAVPAGTYSLWVIPAQSGDWTFIINKQHGQWGTVYDAKQDLVRIPVRATQLTSPTETLQIGFVPSPQNSVITIEWERTQLTIPFAIK